MKHACSHRMDKPCPYCELEKCKAFPIGSHFSVDATKSLRGKGGKGDPMPFMDMGASCFRRMPTNREP
jgi:hypothetical protein